MRFDGDASASLHLAHIVPWIFQVAVLGTEANLYLSAPKPLSNPEVTGELHLQPAGGTQREEVRLEPCEPLILQLDAFASAIRNGAEHDVNGEEGRRTVAVVEAAIQSSMSGAIEPVVS